MTRIATLAAALLLFAQGAAAASLGPSGTPIGSFDATETSAAGDARLEFLSDGTFGDLLIGPLLPELGGTGELDIALNWDLLDPGTLPGGFVTLFDAFGDILLDAADPTAIGSHDGVIAVVFDVLDDFTGNGFSSVLVEIAFVSGGPEAGDPFAVFESLADGTLVGAGIALYGDPAPIPAPLPLVLLASALGGTALLRRGRRAA